METVSVIIPTWNRELNLMRAVQSVLAQTCPVHEILICDDGSTDNSEKAICSFKDSRIKWLPCGRNGRPAIPRNIGIRKSTGEWLAFLDDDDEWLPEKLELQLKGLKESLMKAACSNAIRVTTHNEKYLTYQDTRISFNELIKNNLVICSSVVFHRSLIESVKGFPEDEKLRAIEDYALWLRISTCTDFFFIKDPLLKYYDDPHASIRSKGKKERQQKIIVLHDFISWCKMNPNITCNEKVITAKQIIGRTRMAGVKKYLKDIFRFNFLEK